MKKTPPSRRWPRAIPLHHRWAGAGLAIVVSTLGGCRGCDDSEPPPALLQVVPATAQAALIVGDMDGLMGGIDGFLRQATSKAGGDMVQRFRAGVIKQLGFDPTNAAAYEKGGVQPGRGLALFVEDGVAAMVVAVDPAQTSTFDKALSALIERIDGANSVKVTSVRLAATDGGQATTRDLHGIGRAFGDVLIPVVQWTHVHGYALLRRPAMDEDTATQEQRFARLADSMSPKKRRAGAKPKGNGLAGSGVFSRLRQHLGAGQLLLFAQGNSTDLARFNPLARFARSAMPNAVAESATMTSLRLSTEGLSLDTLTQLITAADQSSTARHAAALAPFLANAPTTLRTSVEDGAVLVALTNAGNAATLKALSQANDALATAVSTALDRIERATGVNLTTDIAPHTAGPLTAAVYIENPQAIVEQIKSRRLSLPRLLDSIHLAISAELKDPDAMWSSLGKAQKHLASRGIVLSEGSFALADKTLPPARTIEPASRRIGWGIIADTYLYTAGPGRLQRALQFHATPAAKRNAISWAAQGAAAELMAEKSTGVLIVRGAPLAKAATAIKVGSGGFAVGLQAALHSAAQVLTTIGDIVISVRPEEDRIRLKVRQRFAR